jgi:hypothetical protein
MIFLSWRASNEFPCYIYIIENILHGVKIYSYNFENTWCFDTNEIHLEFIELYLNYLGLQLFIKNFNDTDKFCCLNKEMPSKDLANLTRIFFLIWWIIKEEYEIAPNMHGFFASTTKRSDMCEFTDASSMHVLIDGRVSLMPYVKSLSNIIIRNGGCLIATTSSSRPKNKNKNNPFRIRETRARKQQWMICLCTELSPCAKCISFLIFIYG